MRNRKTRRRRPARHDRGYKLLFSEPAMVADLLRGFVREPWVEELDLSTLERRPGSYVSDDLRERHCDIVWRVRFRDRWLYLYLLLEFQSTVDPFMAARVMTYVGLLYQDVIRNERLKAGGRLPPVLPVVLYNGKRRWDAARDVSELLPELPGGLERFTPRVSYLLLDEGTFSEADLALVRNLAAALFRAENSRSEADLAAVVECLIEWLSSPQQERLRRAFAVWIDQVVMPGKLGMKSPRAVYRLEEVRSMLAERVKEWTRPYRLEGRREGLEKGLKKGRREGRAASLLELMEVKFGVTSEETRRRIEAAGEPELAAWGRRLLAASTLEEVFAGDERPASEQPPAARPGKRRAGR